MAKIHLLEELRFWFPYIEAFNVYGTQPKFSPGAVIFCDATMLSAVSKLGSRTYIEFWMHTGSLESTKNA